MKEDPHQKLLESAQQIAHKLYLNKNDDLISKYSPWTSIFLFFTRTKTSNKTIWCLHIWIFAKQVSQCEETITVFQFVIFSLQIDAPFVLWVVHFKLNYKVLKIRANDSFPKNWFGKYVRCLTPTFVVEQVGLFSNLLLSLSHWGIYF